MSKHRTSEERREQVGDALMRTVAARGLERTTIRQVADAAGVSVGLVQRYFATKDDLLRFGIAHVYRRTQERVAAVPVRPPVRSLVQDVAEALLPLDDERERECRVWLAFVQAALNDPDQRVTHERAAVELVTGLSEALAGAQRAGELDASVDAGREAAALAAFLDGLTLNGVATPGAFGRDTLRSAVTGYLDRLFGGSP